MTADSRAREILFLAHRIPFPPDRGDKIRSYNIVKRLAQIAPVHIATFADDAADAAHQADLCDAMGSRLASLYVEQRRRSKPFSLVAGTLTGRSASMAAFASRGMHDHVRRLLAARTVSTIFAFSGQMAQYVPENTSNLRFVMDFVDVDSAKIESYADDAAVPLNWLYRREAARLAREECTVARRANVSLFVTQAERDLFRTRSGLADRDIRALENGVALSYFDPEAPIASLARDHPLIVFSGQMDYAPNVAAVSQFAKDGLPRVRAAVPNARFAIVGRNPTPAVTALARCEGVDVVGAVDDMRPWLRAADVVVAPLQIARGVQNKVLEAMAMGRAVVASPAAFEGIDAQAGRDLVVADGTDAAEAVVSLLLDPAGAKRLGTAARARMCERYAWERQLADLPSIVTG